MDKASINSILSQLNSAGRSKPAGSADKPKANDNSVSLSFSGKVSAASVRHFDSINFVPSDPTDDCTQINAMSLGSEAEEFYLEDGVLYGRFPSVWFNIYSSDGDETDHQPADGMASLLENARVYEVVADLRDASGKCISPNITDITVQVESGDLSFTIETPSAPSIFE